MIRRPEEDSMKLLILTLMILSSAAVMASGGGSIPSMSQPAVQKSPTERAVDSYNAGIKNREKAWKYQNKAANETDPKKVVNTIILTRKRTTWQIRCCRFLVIYKQKICYNYLSHSIN